MNLMFTAAPPLLVPSRGAWWDANDPSGNAVLPSDTSAIDTWKDKFGLSCNATSTLTTRPTIAYNTLAGKPTIVFDGSNDKLDVDTGSLTIPGSDNTIFVVSKSNSLGAAAQNIVIGWDGVSTAGYYLQYGTSGAADTGFKSKTVAGGSVRGADAVGAFTLFTARRSGTTQAISLNGGAETTNSNAVNSTITTFCIGAFNASSYSEFLNGNIAEIIIYRRSLSVSERLFINRYLLNKWGLVGI